MPRTIEDDELMTVAQVAGTLRLNEQTIRNWIDAGKLPHVRVGDRRVRVWRSDFHALVGEPTALAAEDEPTIWDGVVPLPVASDER